MEQPLRLSRNASLPLIASIPIAGLGILFTVLYALLALIPDGMDEGMQTLGILFYTFLLPFLLIAVPLMALVLRKSHRNVVVFEGQAVSFNEQRYGYFAYDLVYYPIRLGNYLRYRPGLLALRKKGEEGLDEEERSEEIEIGYFTRGELKRLTQMGLRVERV